MDRRMRIYATVGFVGGYIAFIKWCADVQGVLLPW